MPQSMTGLLTVEKELESIDSRIAMAAGEINDIMYGGDPPDQWDDPDPADYESEQERYERLKQEIKDLKARKEQLLLQREAAQAEASMKALAAQAREPREEAMRRVEWRVGWAATISIGALGSLAFSGRLSQAPAQAARGLGLAAISVLGIILARHVTIMLLNGYLEVAANVKPGVGKRLLVHRIAVMVPSILPWIRPAFLVLALVATAFAAYGWIEMVALIAKVPSG